MRLQFPKKKAPPLREGLPSPRKESPSPSRERGWGEGNYRSSETALNEVSLSPGWGSKPLTQACCAEYS